MSKQFRGLNLSEYSKILLDIDSFITWKFKDKHRGINTMFDKNKNCIIVSIYLKEDNKK